MTAPGLTLSTMREALANQIRSNISRDVTVRAYRPTTSGPTIVIDAASDYLDYWVTFTNAGVSGARFDLTVDPAGADLESSLRRLDDFLSAGMGNDSSVIDALMVDQTLGLADVTSHIRGAVVDVESVTAVISVEIHVKKS